MALSGSFYTNVGSHWRVYVSWSGSQSISGNYTDITMNVYWQGTTQYGTTYSSATKSGRSVIDGTQESFSFSAKLTGAESKHVKTQTKRVYHADNGTKSISMSASLDIELTLSGTYYGTVTASSGTVTLNTIPRKSTLKSSASWTAGNAVSVSINVASTSFTHTVQLWSKNSSGTWVKVAERTGVKSSVTVYFDTNELKLLFQCLAQANSRESCITIVTNGIGQNDYYGTVTNAPASSVASSTDRYRYVDEDFTVNINRSHGGMTHTVRIGFGSFSVERTGVTDTVTFSWTPEERKKIYQQIPNAKLGWGGISITTYYAGVQVRPTPASTYMEFHVRNSLPEFNNSDIDYFDVEPTTLAMKGNEVKHIIQNKSKVKANIVVGARAINESSIDKYVLTLNGQEKTFDVVNGVLTGSVTFDNPISASSNQTLKVKAIDSRGFEKEAQMEVKVVPYWNPTLSITLERRNKFEKSTTLSVNGNFAPAFVVDANKNGVTLLQYRYKERGTTAWIRDWTSISFTTSGGSITGATIPLTLDNVKAFDFEIQITDKLTNIVTTAQVGTGQPILFIDSSKKSVGVNKFPTRLNSFEVEGKIYGSAGLDIVGDISATGDLYGNDLSVSGWGQVDGALTVSGDVTANNNLTVKESLYVSEKGIVFPFNAYGGSGDQAKIFLQKYLNTEDQELVITVGNDTGDRIRIDAGTGYVYIPSKLDIARLSTGNIDGTTVELRTTYPYIDFKDNDVDYDMRIIQRSNNLYIEGGSLTVQGHLFVKDSLRLVPEGYQYGASGSLWYGNGYAGAGFYAYNASGWVKW
jgi:cytoskeletal protein CcmA (bactofilin family)